ncbi:50S ribosomal protein L29 [Campylobacter sp. MIT 21-1685]|uniref:50S ribosomal protein L29 n=1 Tax=unclassified Campylobacter TaxID=2593542 RepID=UPI00224B5C36|nr:MULTISPECIES: 50S ribosomal protein L29 [unclassified Campylobacter]MCX2683619.1 50S ribosomal protein L29 [Campylobacter sp. MIT 21-1684]MCX2751902.1 50S ribosomal protein L29 [Campylobacter sp. MIT 21-1682]MCX2808103.1 50S ribosomal protein L29 [Campylobacter sp. MIT 21-1685]
MKYTEIKDKTKTELVTMLKEKKLLLFTLKQKLRTMQLTNPKEIDQVKKDIARINTAMSALK